MMWFFRKHQKRTQVDERFALALRAAEWGDIDTAASLLRNCIATSPLSPPPHYHLGCILLKAGKQDEAAVAFKAYLSRDPDDHLGAQAMLALSGAEKTPSAMPQKYIELLFDQYAESFDHCLLDNLGYNLPLHLAQAVFDIRKGPFDAVLDLGCGTGLAAEPLRSFAHYIEGVDLSAGMLAVAERKKIYGALHKAEVGAFIKKATRQYDLVLAAEVFIYIGDLSDLFVDIAEHITPDGLFAFSVQKAEKGHGGIGPDRRYWHERIYIEECAARAGLGILSSRYSVLRQENGEPVPGIIFVCANGH